VECDIISISIKMTDTSTNQSSSSQNETPLSFHVNMWDQLPELLEKNAQGANSLGNLKLLSGHLKKVFSDFAAGLKHCVTLIDPPPPERERTQSQSQKDSDCGKSSETCEDSPQSLQVAINKFKELVVKLAEEIESKAAFI
jgi:hypothetical protein